MPSRVRAHVTVFVCFLIAAGVGVASSRPLFAQRLPRENVVDHVAIPDGLGVSNLFQSNMVIQRDKPIRIWGWAKPGEQVTVRLGDREGSSVADGDRVWRVELDPLPANREPQVMTVQGVDESLRLENILVGDVWVLGGQSNMEFELAKVENGQLEIVSAHYPEIRILTVPYGVGPRPQTGFARLEEWSDWFGRHFRKGDWNECTPEVAAEFSAIGFAFARRVHMASQVPIGVIDASRGGTTVEAWTPQEVLRRLDDETLQTKLSDWDARVEAWDAEADLENRIARHRQQVERLVAEEKPIPENLQQEPTDLQPGPIADPNYPGNSFAGMIGPLRGLSVKGVLFHQGYNNAFDGSPGAMMYRAIFPEMIRAWRTAFDDDGLPFGILSLCTAGEPQTLQNYCEMMYDAGVEIRAAQYDTYLELVRAGDQHIGFASTYDLRRKWYHPQVKIPAGERIARWALATEYGFARQLPWQPPMLVSMEQRDGSLLLTLDTEVGDPEEGAILGFAIAGEDRRFHPAQVAYLEVGQDDRGRPRFDRKQLVLTSPLVQQPIHFRYAWSRNPLANLQAIGNKDLPFATQRSDDWMLTEVPLGVLDGQEGLAPRAQNGLIQRVLREQDADRQRREAELLLGND